MSLWSLMCIKLRARGKMRLVDKYVHRTYKKNYTSLFRLQILFHAHIKIFESICLPVCSACCYTSIFDAMCLYWTVHSHTSFYNAHKRNGTERKNGNVCDFFCILPNKHCHSPVDSNKYGMCKRYDSWSSLNLWEPFIAYLNKTEKSLLKTKM